MRSQFLLIMLLVATSSFAAEVKLESEQRESLGIETAAPLTVDVPRHIQASAQVVDPSALIALMGDLHAAQLTASSSRNELERLERLHADDANVSLKAVEAARAQAAVDSGKALALKTQLATAWGRSLVALQDKERTQFVDDLANGRISLVRAEVTDRDVGVIEANEAQVHSLADDEKWSAQVLGRTAQAADRSIGVAYLLRVAADLQPNRVLAAELSDAKHPRHGFKLPRGALLRWQGSDWIFVETEPN
ncbi:MAG TPA: hypothetical protein VET48_13495, partial [Steroidobacteraceae bacterium]|nr:hypothetical protein [Steroidobacteraceae bacterium]